MAAVATNARVAVPSCHGAGKSHLAARLIAWWVCVHPPGTALAVSTATVFRQVRAILWPAIRRLAAAHELPGRLNHAEWWLDASGTEVPAAYGLRPDQPEGLQGIHAPHVLVVVDEAGGITHEMGDALIGLLTGSHARLLAIGNPPIAEADSWFERFATSPDTTTIRLDAFASPNFTGEDAGLCKSCPPNIAEHPLASHIVGPDWVDAVERGFGRSSPYWRARVEALFPTGELAGVIPADWVELAMSTTEPTGPDDICLGVDVAADGGDEFVIALKAERVLRIVHARAGVANANAVDVAGEVLRHILEAEELGRSLGHHAPPTVNVDAIGVGWGVASTLKAWGSEGRHQSNIVAVNVAERASQPDRGQPGWVNKRAESWWALRSLLEPDPTGQTPLRLDIDRTTFAQLTGVTYGADSTGRIKIESKESIKKRGKRSPDRADALVLAAFKTTEKRVSVFRVR